MKSILLVAMFATACGSALGQTETLTEAVRSYNEGMRWQRYEIAANHIPVKERSVFVDEMDERADDLKITDYEVVKVDPEGEKVARVQVKVSWYLDSEGTVRETHAVQTWERHNRAWWMVEEARVRGDQMPGLTDSDRPKAKDAVQAGTQPQATDPVPTL